MLDSDCARGEVARYMAGDQMAIKTRDIAPFGLRLSPQLRSALQHEATQNDRSLTFEIIQRLEASLSHQDAVKTRGYAGAHKIGEPSPNVASNDIERALLGVIRKLPPEKQLALLSLFK